MENKDAFRRWLESRGAKSKHSQNNPVYAIETIERKLHELGTPFPDLNSAWREDEFKSLRDSLMKMLEDAREGGQDFRVLFPETETPERRIKNSIYQLKRYGQFLDGSPPGASKDAVPIERDDRIDRPTLEGLKRRFETVCPDFRNFENPGTGRARQELAFKRKASEKVQAAATESEDDQAVGKTTIGVLQKGDAKGSPLLDVHTERKIKNNHPELLSKFYAAIGRLVRSDLSTEEALREAFSALEALREHELKLTYGVRINFVFSALGMVRPREAAPLKITHINDAWEKLTGKKLFIDGESDWVSDYRRFVDIFSELFRVMRDEWRWQPRDWLDIQGFLWIAAESPSKTEEDATSDTATVASPLNRILYGPPGTGKTFCTVDLAVSIIDRTEADGDSKHDLERFNRLRFDPATGTGNIALVTFHQNFAYEDFVEGIRPVLDEENLRYELRDGIFKRIAQVAIDRSDERFVLIIDEINRGNIAKIFGELITLIEDSRRHGRHDATSVTLPYSQVDFTVPANLYLIGTMNTADRSIQLLDTALRRRFKFLECMPNPKHEEIPTDVEGVNCQHLLQALNERITLLLDREHQVGHTYFFDIRSLDKLADVFRHSVFALLQEYFFDDWAKIKAVLNNNGFVIEHKPKQSVLDPLADLLDEDRKAYHLADDEQWIQPQPYRAIYDSESGSTNSG